MLSFTEPNVGRKSIVLRRGITRYDIFCDTALHFHMIEPMLK